MKRTLYENVVERGHILLYLYYHNEKDFIHSNDSSFMAKHVLLWFDRPKVQSKILICRRHTKGRGRQVVWNAETDYKGRQTEIWCKLEYPRNSSQNWITQNLVCPWLIYQLHNILKCRELSIGTVVLCANFQNDWATDMDVICRGDLDVMIHVLLCSVQIFKTIWWLIKVLLTNEISISWFHKTSGLAKNTQ